MISEQEKSFVVQRYSMMNDIPSGMFVMRDDFTVLAWNTCIARWTGIDKDKINGKNITLFFPRFTEEKILSRLEKVFKEKDLVLFSPERYSDLIPCSHSKEKFRTLKIHANSVESFTGKSFYALFTIEDITALSVRMSDFETIRDKALEEISMRTSVEEELKQKNLILQGILSASPIAIILVEKRVVVWGNEAARKLFAYDHEEEYIGKDTRSFYASGAWYQAAETVVRTASEKILIEVDAEFIKKNGEIFTGHMMVSCIDPVHPFDRSIVTISDLSTRIQAEQDRIYKEKILSVLEMAGAVCHELNQPLMAISGYSELLMLGLESSHPHYEKLNKIHEQIKRTGTITKKLMSITKYETRKYTEREMIFDLKALKTPDI
ncbi:MAG: PAS domain S-box protein [Desulfobacteraceae bacterium]|jgi:PAS domain S-box-containing protein